MTIRMTMVEVFKTNVSTKKEANRIVKLFESKWERYKVNFDLHDCDKILRIESSSVVIDANEIIAFAAFHNIKIIIIE